jgi:hypothetical protein
MVHFGGADVIALMLETVGQDSWNLIVDSFPSHAIEEWMYEPLEGCSATRANPQKRHVTNPKSESQ